MSSRGSFGTSSFYRLTITTWLSSPFEVLIQPFADDVYRKAGYNGNEKHTQHSNHLLSTGGLAVNLLYRKIFGTARKYFR